MFKLLDGRRELFQWDQDRKLVVLDPAIDEVHFCNGTDDCSLVCEVYEENGLAVVDIPNILLQTDWPIRAYGYCGGCYTKQVIVLKVNARTKPADYVYTETEIKRWDDMEQRIERLETEGIAPEVLEQSINNYFVENPIETGATAEEAAQIAKNTADIKELQEKEVEIDLSDYALKSEIPTVPTQVSAFENDAGYLISGTNAITADTPVILDIGTAYTSPALKVHSATSSYINDVQIQPNRLSLYITKLSTGETGESLALINNANGGYIQMVNTAGTKTYSFGGTFYQRIENGVTKRVNYPSVGEGGTTTFATLEDLDEKLGVIENGTY